MLEKKVTCLRFREIFDHTPYMYFYIIIVFPLSTPEYIVQLS